MRADARRNRERIVTAALTVLTTHGASAPMEKIAQTAGLSVGALYRHFPDRRALLEHIAVDSLTALLTEGRKTRANVDLTRWEALERVVAHCVRLPLGVTKPLSQAPDPGPRLTPLMAESDELLRALARDAQREGSVRGDLTPDQVLEVLKAGVCRPGARMDDPLTAVVMSGLRAH